MTEEKRYIVKHNNLIIPKKGGRTLPGTYTEQEAQEICAKKNAEDEQNYGRFWYEPAPESEKA